MNRDNYILIFRSAFEKIFQWDRYNNPELFWLLLVTPFLITYYIFKQKKDQIEFHFSSTNGLEENKAFEFYKHIPFVLTLLGFILMVFAIARPQDSKSWEETKTEGIDVVITMDVSPSMQYKDFKPNRLEASKKIAIDFINERPYDRFGLVVFGEESFTQCPLTIDHLHLTELLQDIEIGMVGEATAIGSGIATAVKRLKDSEAKSKVIILLTDGENTSFTITPKTAADLAKTFGIKIYTIGIGTKEHVHLQNYGGGFVRKFLVETKINTKEMTEIAESTGGRYYRATNVDALRKIYEDIDLLEKTELASLKFYKKTELFFPFALAGILLFVLAKIFDLTLLKSID